MVKTNQALTYGQLQEILYGLGFSPVETPEARVYHKADTDVWIALPPAPAKTPVDTAHLTGVRMILTAGNVTSMEAFAALIAQKSPTPRQVRRTATRSGSEAA
jgi:hypothetical protein